MKRLSVLAWLLLLAACDGRSEQPAASAWFAMVRGMPSLPPSGSSGPSAPAAAADLLERATFLRVRLEPRFHVVIEPPFVVVGDCRYDEMQDHVENTVRWAVTLLKKDFFERDPTPLIDVYLFKDEASYTRNALRLFHDTPTTPYGYYSPGHRALIMNIGTGGGTLVHEMVHAFMSTNFPDCPPWFNEGLGSLFERPAEVDGRIEGLPNWRLPGLQDAIRERRTVPFETLFAMDRAAFYDDAVSGVNYAQARYLLYWVQLEGLLPKLYRELTAHQKDDPGGFATVFRVLGESDPKAFQERWERWALALQVED